MDETLVIFLVALLVFLLVIVIIVIIIRWVFRIDEIVYHLKLINKNLAKFLSLSGGQPESEEEQPQNQPDEPIYQDICDLCRRSVGSAHLRKIDSGQFLCADCLLKLKSA